MKMWSLICPLLQQCVDCGAYRAHAPECVSGVPQDCAALLIQQHRRGRPPIRIFTSRPSAGRRRHIREMIALFRHEFDAISVRFWMGIHCDHNEIPASILLDQFFEVWELHTTGESARKPEVDQHNLASQFRQFDALPATEFQ